ncbi:MAG: hypothetical protein IKG55_05310 [Solobacterium sp.]|nr:hypothetical protein [Solobacterium sp.]
MKNLFKLALAAAMTFTLAACSSAAPKEEEPAGTDTVKGTYTVEIRGFDWGCGTVRAIVTLDQALDGAKAEDFTVKETKQATDWTAEGFPVIEAEFDRKITGASLSKDGKTLTLDLYCSPDKGSPFLYTMATGYNTWCDPYYLTIALADGAEVTCGGTKVTNFTVDTALDITKQPTSIDHMKTDKYKAADGTEYGYLYYEPETKANTLFVWLHGAGEGGTEKTDPRVIALANRADQFANDEFQAKVGGAYVLEPQCPTFWLDEKGDGSMGNEHGGSVYTESVVELINWFKAEKGCDKVVIAGDSNGGFMTMNLAINHPEIANAYIPVCEAYKDEYITDDQIAELAKLNMFFVYSLDDTTVDPTVYEAPTIKRLQDAGATNLHVATTEHVIGYVDENDPEHQYAGHWSWIYFENGDSVCTEDGLNAWDWIAEIVK